MMLELARWVVIAVIFATGMAGSALIALDTLCTPCYPTSQRGIRLLIAACAAAVVYAVAYVAVPGLSR